MQERGGVELMDYSNYSITLFICITLVTFLFIKLIDALVMRRRKTKECFRCQARLGLHLFVIGKNTDKSYYPPIILCCTNRNCVRMMGFLSKDTIDSKISIGTEKDNGYPCIACLVCGLISFSQGDIDNKYCVKCDRMDGTYLGGIEL